MPKQMGREHVDLNESSVWGKGNGADGDAVPYATIDGLESITGSADEPALYEGDMGEQFDQLDASTDEEVDALKVNLLQDDELSNARDGSGIIYDDLAEERIGKLTETGPYEDGQGTVSVSPGSDDTSSTLRRHHANTEDARTDDIVEGSVDEM